MTKLRDSPCNFVMVVGARKLPDGPETLTTYAFLYIQYRNVTDRRTDRQTDRQTERNGKTISRSASKPLLTRDNKKVNYCKQIAHHHWPRSNYT